MRILVLGAGALGGLFGGKLLKGGVDVSFLVRPRRAEQLKRDGLIVKTQDGDIRTPVKILQQGQIERPFDVILLGCKAYDLEDAMNAIAPAVGEQSVVLPVLNGVRHIDLLRETFGAQRVLGGLTFINAALLADGTIQQTLGVRANVTMIGELDGRSSPRCDTIKTAFGAGGVAIDVVNDIVPRLWNKFFGYACFATIAALTRARAGAIAQSKMGASLVSAVIDECTRVVTAEGYPPPEQIIGLVRGAFSQPDSNSRVSMQIDMDEGRPTEGEQTIGDLVERARQRGIAIPILTAAICNLQIYEINRAQRAS